MILSVHQSITPIKMPSNSPILICEIEAMIISDYGYNEYLQNISGHKEGRSTQKETEVASQVRVMGNIRGPTLPGLQRELH